MNNLLLILLVTRGGKVYLKKLPVKPETHSKAILIFYVADINKSNNI